MLLTTAPAVELNRKFHQSSFLWRNTLFILLNLHSAEISRLFHGLSRIQLCRCTARENLRVETEAQSSCLVSPGHPGLVSEEQWSVCHPGLAMRDREMTTEAASEEQWSVGHPGLRGTAGKTLCQV